MPEGSLSNLNTHRGYYTVNEAQRKSKRPWFPRLAEFSIVFFAVSIALDFVSSVIMIKLLGSASEENTAQINLVQNPSFSTLYWWFRNELFFFALIAIFLLFFFSNRYRLKHYKDNSLFWTIITMFIIGLALYYGGYRFFVGYFGNMNAMANLDMYFIWIFFLSLGLIVLFGGWYVFAGPKHYNNSRLTS